MKDTGMIRSARSAYTDANTSFSGCDMVVSIDAIFPGGKKYSKVVGSLQTITYSIHMDKFPVRSVGNVNAKAYTFGPRTIAGTLIFAVFDRHFAYDMLEAAAEYSPRNNHHPLMDEMPPLNITITFANEYGKNARLALYGILVVNEGQTMSINDIYTENTYQFVATDIEYLNDAASGPLSTRGKENADTVMVGARKLETPKPVLVSEEEEYIEEEYQAVVPEEDPEQPSSGGGGSGGRGMYFEIK